MIAVCPRCRCEHVVPGMPDLPPPTERQPVTERTPPPELPAWPDEPVTAVQVPHPPGVRP